MKEFLKNIISNSISEPAVAINPSGYIVFENKAGKNLLTRTNLLSAGEKQIDLAKKNQFSDIINESLKNSEFKQKDIVLGQDASVENYRISITPVQNGDNLFLIVMNALKPGGGATHKYRINEEEIEQYLSDEKIRSIIDKIKSSFPFTFIGKQKFQRDIDKLDGLFLIKEPTGKIVIANKHLADSLGTKTGQLISRSIYEYYSAVENEVIKNAVNFIVKTNRSIIYELGNKSEYGMYVETPLLDLDEKLIAIIEFTVKYKPAKSTFVLKSHSEIVKSIVQEVKSPALLLDKNANILTYNEEYKNIYLVGNIETRISGQHGIPEKFVGQLNTFMADFDAKQGDAAEFSAEDAQSGYQFRFKKIYYDENNQYILVQALSKATPNEKSELKAKMYDVIMHTSPEPMFIYDIDNLRFLEVNHAALRLYGYTRDEFLEMDLSDLYAPEDIQTLIESSPSKTTTSDFTGPWRHKHKDGRTILVEISKSPFEYDGKKAHFNIIRDVTNYLNEKKSLSVYKSLYENTDEVFVNTDADGFIISFNENFLKEFKYDKNSVKLKPFLSIVADEDRAKINSEVFHSGIKRKQIIATKIKTADNQLLAVKIVTNPIANFDDEIDSFGILIKLSAAKTKEVIIKEVPAQTNPIDSSFLSNLFHEILTPINVITGFVQELAESISNPSKDQEEAISYIKDNQQLLLQIMNNAVEYSNLEQNNLELQPEDIVFVEILEEIEENITKAAKSKGVEFTYGKISSSLKFTTDKLKFTTFVSLIVNFSIAATGKNKIYLSAFQKAENSFLICIKDDRHSISPELVKNLQNMFDQDENIIKQNFGISRFAVRLARKLFTLLHVNSEVIKENNMLSEFAFEFPLKMVETGTVVEPEVAVVEDRIETPKKVVKEVIPSEDELQEETVEIIEPVGREFKKQVSQPVRASDTQSQSVNVNVNLQPAQNAPGMHGIEKIVPESEPVSGHLVTPRAFTDLTCLYVEDQVDSQILFKVQMKDLKSIDFANSFEKALPILQNKRFDFIVMDINLQGEYNGLDALRAIQKMPGLSDTPVIAATAYVLPGDREKFIAAGFIDFITKPILRDKLENVVKKIFS
ncbi:MAG: PAS domain S-box protein [Melioribacteraceae bacterium]|nr:PAS domain S-box protein [Melioribacteraceae bacterium]